jgi:hypothetical protein
VEREKGMGAWREKRGFSSGLQQLIKLSAHRAVADGRGAEGDSVFAGPGRHRLHEEYFAGHELAYFAGARRSSREAGKVVPTLGGRKKLFFDLGAIV